MFQVLIVALTIEFVKHVVKRRHGKLVQASCCAVYVLSVSNEYQQMFITPRVSIYISDAGTV